MIYNQVGEEYIVTRRKTMLVLERGDGQSFLIDDPADPQRIIEIVVMGIDRGEVKIGITAPPDVAVHRKEVWLQVQAEKQRDQDNKQ